MFSLRIVTVDHYLSSPVKGFDVSFSDFRGAEIYKVPVIRVFGITPAGQKCCLHVHGVFPYLTVPYDDDLPIDQTSSAYRKYAQELAYSVDKALNIAARKSNSNRHHVYKIILESRIPFYGYHEKKQPFLKIFFYNPVDVKKTMELLSTGLILNKVIQPYEAHIPFTLQFFIDYSLFGMNLINISSLKFRLPHEEHTTGAVAATCQVLEQSFEKSFSSKIWNISALKSSEIVSDIKKKTSCELEADCCASCILNHLEGRANQGENPGLLEIWEEERQRRRERKGSSQITPATSQERSQVLPTESEKSYRGQLKQFLREKSLRSIESFSTSEVMHSVNASAHEEDTSSSNQDSILYSQDKVVLSMVLSIINSESYHRDNEEDSILSCKTVEPDDKDEEDETLEMSSIIDEESNSECGFNISASPNQRTCHLNTNTVGDGNSENVENVPTSSFRSFQESNYLRNFSPLPMNFNEGDMDFRISQLDGADDLNDFTKPGLRRSRKTHSVPLAADTKEKSVPMISCRASTIHKKSDDDEVQIIHESGSTSYLALEYSNSQPTVADSISDGKKGVSFRKINGRAMDNTTNFHPKKQKRQPASSPKMCSDSTKQAGKLRSSKYLPISGLHTFSPSKNNSRGDSESIPLESCKESNGEIYHNFTNSFIILPTDSSSDVPNFGSKKLKGTFKLFSGGNGNSVLPTALKADNANQEISSKGMNKTDAVKNSVQNKLSSKTHKTRNGKSYLRGNQRKACKTEVKRRKLLTSADNRSVISHNKGILSEVTIPSCAKHLDLRKIGHEKVVVTKVVLGDSLLTSCEALNKDNALDRDSCDSRIQKKEHTVFKSSTKKVHTFVLQAGNGSSNNLQNIKEKCFKMCQISDLTTSCSKKKKESLKSQDTSFGNNYIKSLESNALMKPCITPSAASQQKILGLLEKGNKKVQNNVSSSQKFLKPEESSVFKDGSFHVSKSKTVTSAKNRKQNYNGGKVIDKKNLNAGCTEMLPNDQLIKSQISAFSRDGDICEDANAKIRLFGISSTSCLGSANETKAGGSKRTPKSPMSEPEQKIFLSTNTVCSEKKLTDIPRSQSKTQHNEELSLPLLKCQTSVGNIDCLSCTGTKAEKRLEVKSQSKTNLRTCTRSCTNRPETKTQQLAFQHVSSKTKTLSAKGERATNHVTHGKQTNGITKKRKVATVCQNSLTDLVFHENDIRFGKSTASEGKGEISCDKMDYVNSSDNTIYMQKNKDELDFCNSVKTHPPPKYEVGQDKTDKRKGVIFEALNNSHSNYEIPVLKPLCLAIDTEDVLSVSDKLQPLSVNKNGTHNFDLKSNKKSKSSMAKVVSDIMNKDEEYQDVLYNLAFLSPGASHSNSASSPPRCWSPNSFASEIFEDSEKYNVQSQSTVENSKCENLHLPKDRKSEASSPVIAPEIHLLDSYAGDLLNSSELLCADEDQQHLSSSFSKFNNSNKLDVQVIENEISKNCIKLGSIQGNSGSNLRNHLPDLPSVSHMKHCETNINDKPVNSHGHKMQAVAKNTGMVIMDKMLKELDGCSSLHEDLNSESIASFGNASQMLGGSNFAMNQTKANFVQNTLSIPSHILHDVQEVLNYLIISVEDTCNRRNTYCSAQETAKKNEHTAVTNCSYASANCSSKKDFYDAKQYESLWISRSDERNMNSEKSNSPKMGGVSISSSPESLELFEPSESAENLENRKQVILNHFQMPSASETSFFSDASKDENVNLCGTQTTVCPDSEVVGNGQNTPLLHPLSFGVPRKNYQWLNQNHNVCSSPESSKDSEKNAFSSQTICDQVASSECSSLPIPSCSANEFQRADSKYSASTDTVPQPSKPNSMRAGKETTIAVNSIQKHSSQYSTIFGEKTELVKIKDSLGKKVKPCQISGDLSIRYESVATEKCRFSDINSETCNLVKSKIRISPIAVQDAPNGNSSIVQEKCTEPLLINLTVKVPSEGHSLGNHQPDDKLNVTADNYLFDETGVKSFYDYHSPSVLQNSSAWNRSLHCEHSESKISTSQETDISVVIRKTFVLQPKQNPPSRAEVENSCELYEIPEKRHQEAFFSNPLDTIGGRQLMSHIPRAKSTKTSELLDFQGKFQMGITSMFSSIHVPQPNLVSNPSSSFLLPDAILKNPEMRIILAGNRPVILTPACLPPSCKTVEEWTKLHDMKILPKQEVLVHPNSENIRKSINKSPKKCLVPSIASRKPQSRAGGNQKLNQELVATCVSCLSLKLKDKNVHHQEEISPIFPLRTELALTPCKSLMEYRRFKESLHSVSTPVSQFKCKFHQSEPSASFQNHEVVKLCDNNNSNDFFCASPSICTQKGGSASSSEVLHPASLVQSSKRKRKLFEKHGSASMESSPDDCIKTDKDAYEDKILLKTAEACSEQSNSSCSQIDGPSYENTGNYKVNLGKIGDTRSVHMNQYLTIMSVEIHVTTRNDLRPDPKYDAIAAIFYYIYNDAEHGNCMREENLGIIMLDTDFRGDSGIQSDLRSVVSTSVITYDPQCSEPHSSPLNNCHQTAENFVPEHDFKISTSTHVFKNNFVSKLKTELLIKTGVESVSVTSVHDEKMLFEELSAVVKRWDPDILVGYEIQMLSWGYLLQRASHLKINLPSSLSRIQDCGKDPVYDANHSFEFDEYGSEHSSEIHVDGRIVLNVWRIMRKEVTLNRYSFENVFYHVLHQRTPLYSFETLTTWYNGKPSMKQRVFDYYVIRTWGTAKLLDHLDVVARTSELARVFGIQFYDVLNRGSQFRVESMMLRSAKSSNYIPVSPTIRQRSTSRAPECVALIMEPESRFYSDPVVVLDFQSLYPSMMIAYNYCFSTCLGRIEHLGKDTAFEFGCTTLTIPLKSLQKLEDNIHFSPTGIAFVKSSVRQGILPQLLNEILTTRIMVKQSMKAETTNKTLKKLLDARQLGLKLIANVTYGYTAANYSGRMPCVEVADSIVGKARETLERAIHLVEDNPKWKAKVVYGDTDSMFVLLPGRSKDQAFKIGQEIADAVTEANPKPVKLKFEKVYLPCVLQAKKHYVGFMYETIDQKDPVYDAKGIETVRRDTCPAVSKILEKSLKILFNTRDVSLVKIYVQKQFSKLLSGKAGIIDCIFAKEYRGLGGYRPGACVPALEIAKKRLRKDPRSEPRVGERVPYVIIYGFPTLPLIQLVKEPEELLEDKSLHINSKYYITRVITPPLDRVFSLIGIDVRTWYTNMPHLHVPSLPAVPVAHQTKGRTLSQYFTALSCPSCDQPTNLGICSSCKQNPQTTCAILNDKVRQWERISHNLNKICASCAKSTDIENFCLSVDCPIMFRRDQAKKDLSQVPYIRNVLMLDFF